MLTVTEVDLSWIAFAIHDHAFMDGITLAPMNQLHHNIDLVKQNLLEANAFPVDEERAHRIEAYFQDILEAVNHCMQQGEQGEDYDV